MENVYFREFVNGVARIINKEIEPYSFELTGSIKVVGLYDVLFDYFQKIERLAFAEKERVASSAVDASPDDKQLVKLADQCINTISGFVEKLFSQAKGTFFFVPDFNCEKIEVRLLFQKTYNNNFYKQDEIRPLSAIKPIAI